MRKTFLLLLISGSICIVTLAREEVISIPAKQQLCAASKQKQADFMSMMDQKKASMPKLISFFSHDNPEVPTILKTIQEQMIQNKILGEQLANKKIEELKTTPTYDEITTPNQCNLIRLEVHYTIVDELIAKEQLLLKTLQEIAAIGSPFYYRSRLETALSSLNEEQEEATSQDFFTKIKALLKKAQEKINPKEEVKMIEITEFKGKHAYKDYFANRKKVFEQLRKEMLARLEQTLQDLPSTQQKEKFTIFKNHTSSIQPFYKWEHEIRTQTEEDDDYTLDQQEKFIQRGWKKREKTYNSLKKRGLSTGGSTLEMANKMMQTDLYEIDEKFKELMEQTRKIYDETFENLSK